MRIFKVRLDWRRPIHTDVAILDATGADEIAEYITASSVTVIDLDGKRLNFWALIHTIFRGRVNQFNYLCEYLRLVQPRLCVTLIDTTPHIYRLKKRFPDIKTISIQNGWRGFETKRDLGLETGALHIDHMLCFGEAAKTMYSDRISGQFHLIGSFRSNKVPLRTITDSKIVAIISTLRPKVNLDGFATSYSSYPRVTYDVIFKRRLQLATYVAEFCREASMKLVVLGKDFDSSREQHLYTQTLDPIGIDWEFHPRRKLLDSYYKLDQARIVVSSSSSLGYEALGRGIRSAFFMLDPEVTGNWGDKFGWPLIQEDEGPIWTNYLHRDKTIGILWNLHLMSEATWAELRNVYVPRLIAKDPGNTILKGLLEMCLTHPIGTTPR